MSGRQYFVAVSFLHCQCVLSELSHIMPVEHSFSAFLLNITSSLGVDAFCSCCTQGQFLIGVLTNFSYDRAHLVCTTDLTQSDMVYIASSQISESTFDIVKGNFSFLSCESLLKLIFIYLRVRVELSKAYGIEYSRMSMYKCRIGVHFHFHFFPQLIFHFPLCFENSAICTNIMNFKKFTAYLDDILTYIVFDFISPVTMEKTYVWYIFSLN